jgi:AAA15 family ATPase/GTPase
MDNNFIKNIKIEQYKCFENFEVNGFKRINLIGGKNNIGKTAFMEACYIYNNSFDIIRKAKDYKSKQSSALLNNNRDYLYFKILKLMLFIEQTRKQNNFYIDWIREEFDFTNFPEFEIKIKDECNIIFRDNQLILNQKVKNGSWNYGTYNVSEFRNNKYYNKIFKKNNLPILNNKTFISFCGNTNNIINLIDTLKLTNKYEIVNNLLKEIFNIEKIDIIQNNIMLQEKGQYKLLSDFGDGLKQFIYIITVLLSHSDTTIFIDEIENGIHYSLFDKLWEIIFKISKDYNVQVFATTHSKECIESYNKISQNLNDTDTTFIEFGKDKEDNIKANVMNYEQFNRNIKIGNGIRGW